MEILKTMNLLPISYKNKYANKYMFIGFGSLAAVGIMMVLCMYTRMWITGYQIQKLTEENTEYQNKQTEITRLSEELSKYQQFVAEYQKDEFPFFYFMRMLEADKPEGLTLISVDSADRLVTQTEIQQVEPETAVDPEEKNEPQDESEQEAELNPEAVQAVPELNYVKDLSGEKLVVRGYSPNPAEIAEFISTLSKQAYIANVELKAIEEHPINGLEAANLFEAVLQLQ